MPDSRHALRWPVIALLTALLVLLAVAVFYGPLVAAEWRASNFQHRAGPPKLQAMVESGELRQLDNLNSIRGMLPYESISLETGPCFGTCPVYIVTFYRDGRAELIADHLLKDERKLYKGQIHPESFVRLTQLTLMARTAARESSYAGQWTDDSTSIVRATTNGRTWEVSDYGGVSPPEVWALLYVLSNFKSAIEWSPAQGDAG